MKDKIRTKIKEKQEELRELKKGFKESKEEYNKGLDEDYKLRNMLNPFYRKKYHGRTTSTMMLMEVMMTNQLQGEIKELKDLLK